MILSLAPMEGVTGHAFRGVHAEVFGALDCYYSPFIKPPRVGSDFGKSDLRELGSGETSEPGLVPQLLARNAAEFVWAAGLLAKMGFGEMNLNLGCPSRTVTSRGKGAGFLGDPEGLDEFLAEVTERSLIPVSVKTRLGIADIDEYERILNIYCRCPLAVLIVHPRLLEEAIVGRCAGRRLARIEVNSRTAVQMIKRLPGYERGQSIRLLSCSTGVRRDGFAQNLANKLNATVYAPTSSGHTQTADTSSPLQSLLRGTRVC